MLGIKHMIVLYCLMLYQAQNTEAYFKSGNPVKWGGLEWGRGEVIIRFNSKEKPGLVL